MAEATALHDSRATSVSSNSTDCRRQSTAGTMNPGDKYDFNTALVTNHFVVLSSPSLSPRLGVPAHALCGSMCQVARGGRKIPINQSTITRRTTGRTAAASTAGAKLCTWVRAGHVHALRLRLGWAKTRTVWIVVGANPQGAVSMRCRQEAVLDAAIVAASPCSTSRSTLSG